MQGRRCQSVEMSGEGSSIWTLGKPSGEKALNVVVKEYEGQVLIHFRHYFKVSGEDRWYPSKKEWHGL